ncbi:TetR/AcrR family transcriptional regulator [Nonomuraea sp. K274]|uniref:TetR/AcrR family transcriptional regulator n=1 Tax=Nonomuraea cypriaca TaxID=1187855 RepID=A0A931AAB7_9ACTN|nr:TetR/AcrR family transcriptional regulator [Nonomuraea cypriaca]MBF8186948.1 TetR/AcrR family transcriptional regulator [Nonomuraea cypriaca]
MTSEPRERPHTGRRRNPAVRQAILDHAADLLIAHDYAAVSIDVIARAAGVSKHTIYRWWPSKGAVLLEAMAERARQQTPDLDTGVFADDLETFLTATFHTADKVSGLLRGLMAEAQRDPVAAEGLRQFTTGRRTELHALLTRGLEQGELPADADLDLLVDQLFGLMWYRLLIGHAPVDGDVAARLARSLIHREFEK